jgi:hypothetical protein
MQKGTTIIREGRQEKKEGEEEIEYEDKYYEILELHLHRKAKSRSRLLSQSSALLHKLSATPIHTSPQSESVVSRHWSRHLVAHNQEHTAMCLVCGGVCEAALTWRAIADKLETVRFVRRELPRQNF